MRSFSVSKSRRTPSFDANNKSHLPRISAEPRDHDESSLLLENPFRIPPDEEILSYKDKQKEMRTTARRNERNLKIWQRSPESSMRHKLRKVLESSYVEETNQIETQNDNRLDILEAARSAIRNRFKHREPVKEFLSKRKEMFLFQLGINEKKEQIKEFEELAHLQEASLQQSIQMLEKDAVTFHKYVEESKNQTTKAVKETEKEVKEGQKQVNYIIKLRENLSNVISKNAKKVEHLERLYSFRLFLDKLTPEDFFKKESGVVNEKRPRSRERGCKDSDRIEFNWNEYNIQVSPHLLQFLKKEDCSTEEFEMYFKKPEQLQRIFETLEEKNLFIMRHNQELDQTIDILSNNFEEKKIKLTEQQNQLEKSKKDLTKTLHQKMRIIENLKRVNLSGDAEKIFTGIEKGIKKIYLNKKILGDLKSEHEKDGFDMLKVDKTDDIERKLDDLVRELNLIPPELSLKHLKKCKQTRREEIIWKATLLKKEKEEQEKRAKSVQNSKRSNAQKRLGRPIMARSHLVKEEKQEESKDVTGPEEDEKQLYFVKRFY